MIPIKQGHSLEQISKVRRQVKSTKYLMPDGSNQANYRDSLFDVIEELADALHILELTEAKIKRFNPELAQVGTGSLGSFMWELQCLTDDIIELRNTLPEIYSQDQIVVERPCFINREGTELKQTFQSALPCGEKD